MQPPIRWSHQPAQQAFADEEIRRSWDQLNGQHGNLPILDAAAVRAALQTFDDGRQWLAIAHDRDGLAAMIVASRSGPMQWQCYQPSQLPVGCWVARAGLTPLGVATRALSGMPTTCWVMSLTQIDPLLHERPADTDRVQTADYIETAWLDLRGSFDDYWAARGKNLRQNLRKQRKKIADDGVQATMHILRSASDMAQAVARYGVLEASGWKAAQGTAIHPDNDQGRFYTQWLQDAAHRGEAFVTEYTFGDRTVAMNLGLLRAGTLIVLKTTYDESHKALSPASLLREDELKSFFADGEVRRIEYFGRRLEWHTRLTDTHRTLYHLTAYRWAWLQRLAQARRRRVAAAETEQTPTTSDG
ncbi:MAG TPA: GNAT family N-acetyltransferase [Rubrivivax sp.]|nr:GNAT family N-acetyltransferase [Rubrivivax sp.]